MLQALIDGASVFVPAIWRLEVINSLVVHERRKLALPAKSDKFLQDLQQFTITVGSTSAAFTMPQNLELSKRHGIPLATKDEPLRKADEELGVLIFQP